MIEKENTKTNDDFIKLLQSFNINFLIGAGASMPAISQLGNLERELENITDDLEKNIKLYEFIKPIVKLYHRGNQETKDAYTLFINSIVNILNKRRDNNILPVANIFTTNYDLFLEQACETSNNYLNYNDGFQNKNSMFLTPSFDVSEFNKLVYYKSNAYSNVINIPNINICCDILNLYQRLRK